MSFLFPIITAIANYFLFIKPYALTTTATTIVTLIFYYLSCILGGIVLCLIADGLRKMLMPDAVYTTEGFTGLMKAKIFWSVGPQFIAACIIPILWMVFRFMR